MVQEPKQHITVVRAVGISFVYRKLKSLLLVGIIVAAIAIAIVIWLVTVDGWWWLLAIPIVVLLTLGVIGFVIAFTVLRLLRPVQTKQQQQAVEDFVDKLERVTDNLQTPAFIIVFRVVRDVIWPRKVTFVQQVTKDGTSLHTDYAALVRRYTS